MRSFWLLACLLLSLSAGAAQRVVSLAPSLTDSVLELGAARRLVGVLDGGERPAAIGDLPSVGRYGQVNLERLLELQPDLILVWPGSVPEAQLQRLRDFGIALFIAEPHSLDELALQLAALGEALGEAEAGQRLSTRFREGMRRLAERYRRDKPLKVFYQVWDRPLYTIGGRQVISDALRVCGAENLFGDLPQPAPQVSVEAVLARTRRSSSPAVTPSSNSGGNGRRWRRRGADSCTGSKTRTSSGRASPCWRRPRNSAARSPGRAERLPVSRCTGG